MKEEIIKKVIKGVSIGFLSLLVIDLISFVVCFTGNYGPFEENNSYVVEEVSK